MLGRRLLFHVLVNSLFGRSSRTEPCDMASTIVEEGNIGQTENFNWLGVLRVHLHDVDSVKVAATGIVLIKLKYALGNADDITRIPKRIFETESQAMFLAGNGVPWNVPPVSYITHPEYEYSTYNSIAIIELNIDAADDYPLKPICFPSAHYNTSKYLYLTGYTDENQLLEKVVYRINYLTKADCEEFYNRAGLSDKKHLPTSYICGYAPYNSTHCVWDNGMALVSNASGWFSLIGFGIRGPGCAAPSRFIDMNPYFSWINSVTTLEDEMYDSPDYRRHDEMQFVPMHSLFVKNQRSRDDTYGLAPSATHKDDWVPYPFDTTLRKPIMFNIEPYDESTIAIFPFNTTMEMYTKSCLDDNALMYREIFELRANTGGIGKATYKLTMYDLIHNVCTCVKLSVNAHSREEAIISFKEDLSFTEDTQLGESGETPRELFRYYPLHREIKTDDWEPTVNEEIMTIQQSTKTGKVLNYDLYIKFEFIDYAVLKFEVFAKEYIPTSTTTTTTTPTPQLLRKGSARKNKKKDREWGMEIDNTVKEPVVTIVAEPEVEQATVSKGHCVKGMFAVFYLVYIILI